MKKIIKRFRPAVIVLAAAWVAGCGSRNGTEKEIELLAPAEAIVDVETVLYRDLYGITSRPAEVAAYTEELSFEVGGSVSKLHVELGSAVKAGDLLAEQEEDGVREEAERALNKYLSEKKVYMDAVKDARKKIASGLSASEKKWQEMLIRQAEELWQIQEPELWAAWEAARAKVGNSCIYAPYDGVVTACVTVGTRLAAGQPALALADESRPYIVVNSYLPEAEYHSYERVYAVINGKDTEVTYATDRMEKEATRTYYTAEDWNGAKVGDFALICMMSDINEHVLSIPNRAVYRDSVGEYVYLLQDDVRVRRSITTGFKHSVYTEIVSGLEEGDRVYVKK